KGADVVALLGLANRALLDERQTKAHRVQGVVQIVRDSRSKLTDCSHALLSHQRFAQLIELVPVALPPADPLTVGDELGSRGWKPQNFPALAADRLPSRFRHPATVSRSTIDRPVFRKRDYGSALRPASVEGPPLATPLHLVFRLGSGGC